VSLSVLGLLSLGPVAVAQTISTSVRALAPLTVQVSNGVQSALATQPAGPLPASGQVLAQLTIADEASASWSSASFADRAEVRLRHTLASPPSQPVNAAATAHEFVVEFAAAGGAVPAQVVVRRTHAGSPGVPPPLIAVDLGNDGTIDLQGPGTFFGPAQTVAVQPLQVRVLMTSLLAGAGSSLTDVLVELRPVNGVLMVQNAMDCGPGPGALTAARLLPPFEVFADRGVDALIEVLGAPAVFVIGFGQQPVLLPQNGFVPCLLVPSPDVVLFQSALHVALPPAVRPVTFHMQVVSLTEAGLRVSDGYTVIAQ
jgi:hypothetical protein